jgi:hypothetical protein
MVFLQSKRSETSNPWTHIRKLRKSRSMNAMQNIKAFRIYKGDDGV